jgi:uncharacterized RDD family membrane protein YckC
MKPTAVVGRRVAALILDAILFDAILAVFYFPLATKKTDIVADVLSGKLDPSSSTYINIGDYSLVGSKAALFFLLTFVLYIAWFWILPGIKGWSPGKLICSIRIVKDDGSCPPGIGRAIVRQLLWIVDGIFFGLVGFVTALSSKQNKRVGDMVAGTLVVDKQFAGQSSAAYIPTAPMPAAASAPEPVGVGAASAAPKADWYPDPRGEKRLRYWDGSSWTENTAD